MHVLPYLLNDFARAFKSSRILSCAFCHAFAACHERRCDEKEEEGEEEEDGVAEVRGASGG